MNAELLGEVVSWDMHGTPITHSDVQQALRDAGLNPDEAQELTNVQAFGRACKDLRKDRAIDKLDIGGGIAKFQLTRKEKNETTGTIDFDYEAIVVLDCQTGEVSCPESMEIEKQAKELLAFAMQARSAQDVTRLVQRLFAKHADLFPLNSKGCAYFTPIQHQGFTEQVEQFLKKLGGNLQRFPVPRGTAQGNASVKESVENGLAGLLGELNAAVASWDETTRKSTMDKAFERYEAVSYKIDAYSTYLESSQDKLKAKLNEAKAELARKITELRPEQSADVSAAA